MNTLHQVICSSELKKNKPKENRIEILRHYIFNTKHHEITRAVETQAMKLFSAPILRKFSMAYYYSRNMDPAIANSVGFKTITSGDSGTDLSDFSALKISTPNELLCDSKVQIWEQNHILSMLLKNQLDNDFLEKNGYPTDFQGLFQTFMNAGNSNLSYISTRRRNAANKAVATQVSKLNFADDSEIELEKTLADCTSPISKSAILVSFIVTSTKKYTDSIYDICANNVVNQKHMLEYAEYMKTPQYNIIFLSMFSHLDKANNCLLRMSHYDHQTGKYYLSSDFSSDYFHNDSIFTHLINFYGVEKASIGQGFENWRFWSFVVLGFFSYP